MRSSEAEHYKGLINSASDPKQLSWKSLSSIVGNNNHGSSVLHIEDGKQLLTEDKKIAFKFNKFFSSIGSKVAGKLQNVAMNAWEKYENSNTGHDLWELCPVDHKTIFDIVHLLKSNKAAGLDKILTRLIRDAESELTPSIAYLVNKSIWDGKFPALWKLARVTPLHKADDKLKVENYRPISILPVLSKIMERVVHAQLSQRLNLNSFLYHHQYGFRCGYSTVQAVAQLNNWVYNIWIKAELLVHCLWTFRKRLTPYITESCLVS